MPVTFPTYSVVIPAFNEELLLPRTIEAVRESFAAVGVTDYEIVVCDNNSTDRTGSVAQELGVQVVFEPHNQIGRARNAAAERARGEWLLFLDADTFLNRDLLAHTLKAIKAGGIAGGGATLRFDADKLGVFPSVMIRIWNRVSTTFQLAAGSYLFCRRVAWEAVGGFDDRLYAGEELRFSRGVKRWGRKLGLRFRILTKSPVVTSARKMDWYSSWQLLGHCTGLLWPGARGRKDACGLWYERPEG